MDHRSHPHPLRLKPGSGAPYTCDGCREHGVGASYRCGMSDCTYVLHKECAHIVVPTTTHRFFKESRFEFHEKPLAGRKIPNCDACGKDVLGFVYHCPKTKKHLHPCCLNLREDISVEGGDKKLELCGKVPSKCLNCSHKRVGPNSKKGVKGWSYVYPTSSCNPNGYCYHVSCFKDLIHESWRRRSDSSVNSSTSESDSNEYYSLLPLETWKSDRKRRRSRRFKTTCNCMISAICGNPLPIFIDN